MVIICSGLRDVCLAFKMFGRKLCRVFRIEKSSAGSGRFIKWSGKWDRKWQQCYSNMAGKCTNYTVDDFPMEVSILGNVILEGELLLALKNVSHHSWQNMSENTKTSTIRCEKYESQWEGLSHIYIVENKKCLKPPTRWGLSIITRVWFPAHPQIWQSAEELGTQNPILVYHNIASSLLK